MTRVTEDAAAASASAAGEAAPAGVSMPTRLGLVAGLNDASSEVLARCLPLFLTAGLGASPTFVGAVEGAAEAVSILLRGFSGWLSDRLPSRKPLVVVGYGFSLAARFALLGVSVPAWLGAARVFERTGKGLRTAPRDAMVADAAAAGKAGKAFGITRFLDTIGAVTGLLIALSLGLGDGPMTADVFRKVVYAALPPGILAMLVLMVWVPRVAKRTHAKRYVSLKIPHEVRGYLAIVLIFALGNSSDAFIVLRANELGFSFREILMMMVAFNALAAVLAIPAGAWSDKVGRVRFLAAGWLVYGVTYAAFGIGETRVVFGLALAAYGAFYGFTEGVEKALLADLLPPDKRGIGYGALQLVLGLAALPASLLTGYLMTNYGSTAAFVTAGSLALVGCFALVGWSLSGRAVSSRS